MIPARLRPGRRSLAAAGRFSLRAPMSTPLVGSSTNSAVGFAEISRPNSAFCWLPPDSSLSLDSMEAARIRKSSVIFLARPASPARSITQYREIDSRKPRLRFSRRVRLRNTPSVWRSSLMNPTPALRNASGVSPEILTRATRTSPPVRRSMPAAARMNSALAFTFNTGQSDDFAGAAQQGRPDRNRGR